jgi:hypothetical protein
MLKEIDNMINFKKLKRLICAICGRFEIVSSSEYLEYDITYLLKFKENIHKSHLDYRNLDYCFKYKPPFDCLNDLVLSVDGLNYTTNKVFNILNYNSI